MARTVLPFVGAAVGFWIGGPTGAQVGFALGGVVGNAVDPVKNIGPRIGETGAQTSAEGAPRGIVFGTVEVTGNVIFSGALVKGDFEEGGKGGPVNVTERCFRTYAIRICEGPIEAVLTIKENDKLVVDYSTGSTMIAESNKWMFGCGIYYGTEDQLPDSSLLADPAGAENPAYRGSSYMVFVFRDLTDFRGAIPQYRFEVARNVTTALGAYHQGPSSTGAYGTYLTVDEDENPILLLGQNGDAPEFGVGSAGSYTVATFDPDGFVLGGTPIDSSVIGNAAGTRFWPFAIDSEGYGLAYEGSGGYCNLLLNGSIRSNPTPSAPIVNSWYYAESLYYPEYGGLAWFTADYLYLGVRKTNSAEWNCIFKFPKSSIGTTLPLATAGPIVASGSPIFWMHVSRAGFVRAISSTGTGGVQVFDSDLAPLSGVTVPSAIAARFPSTSAIMAFGFDEDRGWQVYMYASAGVQVRIYDLAGALLASYTLSGADTSYTNRIIFTSDAIYIQAHHTTFKIDAPQTYTGVPMVLGDIVAEIHERCGIDASQFDVSELTDEVAGLVLAGDYTGADAINTLRGPYFFDKAEFDLKLWYPKRGAAVIETLTIDDLVDEPDWQMREQALEYPRKFHLFYQHAGSGYAVVKATSQFSSPDLQVVGEVTTQVPIVFAGAEDEAQQTVDKMHKVAWAEAEGEIKFSLPWSKLKYVPSNPIALSLRGRVNRLRLTQLDLHDGVIDVTARHDRQSAYTSNVSGIPIPTPTPPPATIVGSTTLLVLDIPSLRDTEDDLNIYYAVTGAQPAWYGAVVQRSLDGGSTWSTVTTISSAAVIGELLAAVSDASADYTDTTNSVYVRLYRAGQTLDSISDVAFLSEGGAFALENADGSWEICQARDWVEDTNGDFIGTTLHRGRLNSTTNAHAIGRRLVMLDGLVHVPTQSSMIGQSVMHRAPSLSQSPELAATQTATYVGRSQIEWEPASLVLARDVSNIVSGSWAPRYRFGTDDAPVNSANTTGFRITIAGSSTVVRPDQTGNTFSYDASALGASVTVSVQAINRITGLGPATSGTI